MWEPIPGAVAVAGAGNGAREEETGEEEAGECEKGAVKQYLGRREGRGGCVCGEQY